MKAKALYYSGYSPDLSGIADRRRILHYANRRKIPLVALDKSCDIPPDSILVVTSSSDLAYWARFRARRTDIKLYLDVVDGIHGESSALKDFIRGCSYVASGRISTFPRGFRGILKTYVGYFDGIVCSCVEQAAAWSRLFPGPIFDILDFHEEIDSRADVSGVKERTGIFWEGLPYTLKHFENLKPFLQVIADDSRILEICTSLNQKRYLNRYLALDPRKIMRKAARESNVQFCITKWNRHSIGEVSSRCQLGVIPMSLGKSYDHLKAENRLLIMWKLGLPVLTSPLESYLRVQKESGIDFVCLDNAEWIKKYKLLTLDLEFREQYLQLASTYLQKNHSESLLLRKWDNVISCNSSENLY